MFLGARNTVSARNFFICLLHSIPYLCTPEMGCVRKRAFTNIFIFVRKENLAAAKYQQNPQRAKYHPYICIKQAKHYLKIQKLFNWIFLGLFQTFALPAYIHCNI